MQENDFEKQVHQKMGELRLFPSEAVWEQVEMRLHNKDKRRRWIIWFPLLLSGLFLGGYYAVNFGHTSHLNQAKTLSYKSVQKQVVANNDSSISEKASSTSLKNLNNFNPENKDRGKSPDVNRQSAIREDVLSTNKIISPFTTGKPDKGRKSQSIISKEIVGNSLSGAAGGEKSLQVEQQQHAITAFAITDLVDETIVDQPGHELQAVAIIEAAHFEDSINTSWIAIKESQLLKITGSKHQNKGWEWGLTFQGGESAFKTGTLNKIFNNTRNDALLFSNPNQSGNGSASGTPIYLEPYPTKASPGFSAGGFMKKNLSPTFALSIGLNYTYYSTINTVGKRVDSSFQSLNNGSLMTLDRYFRVGNTNSYTNKYHYVEMPVLLQTRLTRNWKRPMYWDLGFSVSKLLASNALHFDNTTGYYFKNNDLLNKTQFNITTALPLTLASGKSFGLQAGPVFTYGLSHVFANESSTGKHFLFFGLKASVILGK